MKSDRPARSGKLSGELSSTTEMMAFKIIDPPTVQYAPVGPNRPLLFSAALGAALVAGIATALLISQVRPPSSAPPNCAMPRAMCWARYR